MNNFIYISKFKFLLVGVCVILSIVPFFWLKPGEIDLGGDSSRLYFYNPISFINNAGIYNVLPYGIGQSQPNYYFIPFVGMLAILKQLISSPYVLISLFNSLKLVFSFLFIYLIVKEILVNLKNNQKITEKVFEISSVLAGLFYVFMPTMTINWDKALVTQNQIFLNPLIFYLLMRYIFTRNSKYLWFTLMTTLIFAPNFSWIGSPSFFSFFPLAILFLFLYVKFIRKVIIPWKGIIIGFLVFFGLHAFHFIPQILNLFDPGSFINTRVFDKQSVLNEGVRYFLAILPLSKVSLKILISSTIESLGFLSLLAPLVVIVGFLLNKRRNKEILLVGIFFLVTLFLLTAKITDLGIIFYKNLFYIPGFSMFRNFIGQWLWVYSFFYSIIFGISLFIIFSRSSRKLFTILTLILFVALTVQARQFIDGELINHKHLRSNKYIAIKMDPDYEKFLKFVKDIPDDGRILTLPFSDSYSQTIAGKNNGAYIGPSTISHLAGKSDFAGYQNMGPFPNVFWSLSKERNYEAIDTLLGLLDIKYIFHNADVNVYDQAFPSSPYEYSRNYLPKDQKGYVEYVKNLTSKEIYSVGPYRLHVVKSEYYLPHFYIAKNITIYKNSVNDWEGRTMSFFEGSMLNDPRVVYINQDQHKKEIIISHIPNITFSKVNPTKYKINISNAKESYLLVFSEAFNKDWKLFLSPNKSEGKNIIVSYFNGEIKEGRHENSLLDNRTFETLNEKEIVSDHFLANGYANAWFIKPQEVNNKENYEITIEMVQQRVFYFGVIFSSVIFIGMMFWGTRLFLSNRIFDRMRKHYDKKS